MILAVVLLVVGGVALLVAGLLIHQMWLVGVGVVLMVVPPFAFFNVVSIYSRRSLQEKVAPAGYDANLASVSDPTKSTLPAARRVLFMTLDSKPVVDDVFAMSPSETEKISLATGTSYEKRSPRPFATPDPAQSTSTMPGAVSNLGLIPEQVE